MKTTRRNLLRFIGLGAAAAALAPAVGVETASAAPYGYIVVPDPVPADLLLDGPNPIKIEPLSIQRIQGTARPATREEYKASLAQARADGYNRGREVETARAESRQARGALTLDEFDAAWSALGGTVSTGYMTDPRTGETWPFHYQVEIIDGVMTKRVPYYAFSSAINHDASRGALARRAGRPYERSWFTTTVTETGERIVARAPFPGESKADDASA